MTFPFTKDRYVHALLERDGDVCLVERTNQLTASVHWELVVLQHEPAKRYPSGRVLPAHERYPAPSQWGSAGWTFTDLTEARQRYRNLLQPKAQKGGSATG